MIGLSRSRWSLALIAITLGLALLSGIASAWFSPYWSLGILGALTFGIVVFRWPEIGLFGILIATSSIISEDQLPQLSLGAASLHVSDIILLALLGSIAMRRLIDPGFRLVRTPLDWPILIFYGVTLLATFVALFRSSVEVEPARRAIRIFSYYLTFFVVTNLVRKRSQVTLLLHGFFLLATIVAATMIMQYAFGAALPFLPGRVETLITQGTAYSEVARIIPPGWPMIMVSCVATFCILIQEKVTASSVQRVLQFGLVGSAVVITFMRAYWAALLLVFALSAYLVRGRERRRLVGWSIVGCLILGAILLYGRAEPRSWLGSLVGAAYSRVSTLWSGETLVEGPLQWRFAENEHALRSIISRPLLGLGLGARYRPYDPRIDFQGMTWDATGYIHNDHFGILLNSGLFGYLAFIGLSLTFLIRGFRYWRKPKSYELRGVVLGFILTYVAALIAAVTIPTFMDPGWTPVLGIVLGINEVVLLRFRGVEAVVGP